MAVTSQELAQALSALEDKARRDVLERAADIVRDRHINKSPITDDQIRGLFPGKSDQEIADASQGLLDRAYNLNDGNVHGTINELISTNGASLQPAVQQQHAPAAGQPEITIETLEPAVTPEPEPEPQTSSENTTTTVSYENVAKLEATTKLIALTSGGNITAETMLKEIAEGTAADSNALKTAFTDMGMDAAESKQAAQGILDIAAAEHGGDVNKAISELNSHADNPALGGIMTGNSTLTDEAPAQQEVVQGAPVIGNTNSEPGTQGMTVAQISQSLGSVPAGMITRARLEGYAQNGVPEGIANMIGVTPAEGQAMAKDALALTDSRFYGDVKATVAFLKTKGQEAEYANLTVAQLSEKLSTQPDVVQKAALTAQEQGANDSSEKMTRLMGLFNNESFSRAFQSGDFLQMIEQFVSAITGKPFSMSNDSNAFAGVTTPYGTNVPSGTQMSEGQGVANANNAPNDPEQVTDQQVVMGMRS